MIARRLLVPTALVASLLTALAAPRAATADTRHDSNAPIDVGADHIELQDRANRAILSGNVRVIQAEMTLRAARVTVAYTGQISNGAPEVSRLDAVGGVTITRPDQRARSDYAIYDIDARVLTLFGDVNLVQGGNSVSGARLTINLDTGRAIIDGSAVGGAPGTTDGGGGRVTGRFSVPRRGG